MIDTILDDLEWCNSPYFVFLPNLVALLANYVIVVKNRPIMSAKYCLPISVFHFWPNLTHPAAQSLCNSWATCCSYAFSMWKDPRYSNIGAWTQNLNNYYKNVDKCSMLWTPRSKNIPFMNFTYTQHCKVLIVHLWCKENSF